MLYRNLTIWDSYNTLTSSIQEIKSKSNVYSILLLF